jgi:hypothetical protein
MDTLALVHAGIVGTTSHVQGVATVEAALALLCEGERRSSSPSLRITRRCSRALLKTSRYNPATLTIAISHLRDSRTLIIDQSRSDLLPAQAIVRTAQAQPASRAEPFPLKVAPHSAVVQ